MRDFKHSRAVYYGYHIVQNAKLCFQEQLMPILGLARTVLEVDAEGGDTQSNDAGQQQMASCVRHILGNIDVSLRSRNNAEIPATPVEARQRLLVADTVKA